MVTSVMGSQRRLQENEAKRIHLLAEKGKVEEARVAEKVEREREH